MYILVGLISTDSLCSAINMSKNTVGVLSAKYSLI